jgi:Flp pilus assembly pilin Flp
MKQLASRLCREEPTLSEYALLMALIVFSSISGTHRLAQAVSSIYGGAASNLSAT